MQEQRSNLVQQNLQSKADNTNVCQHKDNSVTNVLLMNKENCALKLVDEIILYYDARSKKHQKSLRYKPTTVVTFTIKDS